MTPGQFIPALRLVACQIASLCWVLLIFFIFRLILMRQHVELLSGVPIDELIRSYAIGLHFDLRVACIAMLPVLFLTIFQGTRYRTLCTVWLTIVACVITLLCLIELEFYQEFQQRLNILVLQYVKEDPETVARMIWGGFPVVTYVLAWVLVTFVSWLIFRYLLKDRQDRLSLRLSLPLLVILILSTALLARGTLRSGPPLRWGDAYFSEVMFLNHLALNGSFTLAKAVMDNDSSSQSRLWENVLPVAEAYRSAKAQLHTLGDQFSTDASMTVRRHQSGNSSSKALNVVIVLMESFSGQYVGTLGNKAEVTPRFDALSKQGVLFTRAFSNGTHTHQGTFATLSCFPNLPGHEYLMQQREGMNAFSGLTTVLPDYNSVFVYNGDFSWDNQNGFFRNQGVQSFVGRHDFVDPVFVDDVWGVSDQDMFDRAVLELDQLDKSGPFIAYLQSLSNHLPYNIPQSTEFDPITNQGALSERLTAMKYSDWALGEFFEKIKDKPYYKDTIFVVLGDHGFGTSTQLTEINLLRFHVPILVIAPGLSPLRSDIVASQVDVIPTILGLLDSSAQHQCWGRDLLNLPKGDDGFAVIKPSGGEATVGRIQGDKILTFDHELGSHLYGYSLTVPMATPIHDEPLAEDFLGSLHAYVQTALAGLKANSTGLDSPSMQKQ